MAAPGRGRKKGVFPGKKRPFIGHKRHYRTLGRGVNGAAFQAETGFSSRNLPIARNFE